MFKHGQDISEFLPGVIITLYDNSITYKVLEVNIKKQYSIIQNVASGKNHECTHLKNYHFKIKKK